MYYNGQGLINACGVLRFVCFSSYSSAIYCAAFVVVVVVVIVVVAVVIVVVSCGNATREAIGSISKVLAFPKYIHENILRRRGLLKRMGAIFSFYSRSLFNREAKRFLTELPRLKYIPEYMHHLKWSLPFCQNI